MTTIKSDPKHDSKKAASSSKSATQARDDDGRFADKADDKSAAAGKHSKGETDTKGASKVQVHSPKSR